MKTPEASVTIREHASEIVSFRKKGYEYEYMWQGDPAFWSGRNPTLFPMVGSTWNKEVVIDGKVYHMGNHGFARHADFTCVEHTDNKIVMELKDSEETLSQYPFHFTLKNTYELDGSTLTVTTTVENTNVRTMPFNLGYHPAFNCSRNEKGEHEGWTLTAGKETIALDPVALKNTIILDHPKAIDYTLSDGTKGVRVQAEGYEWVAFWSPEAPFVCIEPWHSHTDFEEVHVPFEKREGTILLDAGKTFSTTYSITVF